MFMRRPAASRATARAREKASKAYESIGNLLLKPLEKRQGDLRLYKRPVYTWTYSQRRASVIYFEAKPLCFAAMTREKRLTVLSIRVDDTLARALKVLAAADERPVSTYLERILRAHAQERGKDVTARPPRAEQGPRKRPAKKGAKS
jgi:hypothetical protein